MGNEWSHGIERARESDAHVAASLTSALIARATHPCGTSAMHEAENAVNLYRCVLAALAADTGNQLEKSTTPTMESTAMQMLDVSIDRRPTSTTNWMTRFPMRGSIVDVRPKTREICRGKAIGDLPDLRGRPPRAPVMGTQPRGLADARVGRTRRIARWRRWKHPRFERDLRFGQHAFLTLLHGMPCRFTDPARFSLAQRPDLLP